MTRFRVASRIAELRPTAVNRVLDEVRAYQASGRTALSLMRGQPDSPTPAHIVEAAEQSLQRGRTGYPDNQGEPALRQAVADKLRRDQGLAYDPGSEILITDGATCGLALALGAVLEPGDEVLLPDPIYDAYASPIALFGGRGIPVRSIVQGGRFTLERSALEAAHSPRSRALLLNHPWNPVGTVFTSADLQTIVDFVSEHNLVLISDEIYESLVYDGRRHISPASLDGARSRTILVNSLSKTYAMTGWRVGYCAAPAELTRAMLLLLQQFSRGPATFVQDAAACALLSSQESSTQRAAEYQARRDRVIRALQGIPGIRPLIPEGGLFVMVDLRELQDGVASDDVRRFLLERHGVVVIHGSAYGPGGEGLLRVSFAAGGKTLDDGLARLREGLVEIASGQWHEARP
ncbi:MAG TPA: aminotransferase class I/II-fold pyridoxal phosphate-dependent enzyme [Pirellulaceae bacterium]|nr:aminotransferase class I/II-fold pyridoxal phosphate-dependent enzyme [Pirellulaceae bacterium]